jgi:hypothetical protein
MRHLADPGCGGGFLTRCRISAAPRIVTATAAAMPNNPCRPHHWLRVGTKIHRS